MHAEKRRHLAAVDIYSYGGVYHWTRNVTGGFAMQCTDLKRRHVQEGCGPAHWFHHGPGNDATTGIVFPDLVANADVRHIFEGERDAGTAEDVEGPRAQKIPARAVRTEATLPHTSRTGLVRTDATLPHTPREHEQCVRVQLYHTPPEHWPEHG